MPEMQSVKEKPLVLAEAREILEKRQKDGELSYEQQNALDYLQQFSYLPHKKAKELCKELKSLGFLSEAQIALLANLLPSKAIEVRTILTVDAGSEALTDEQIKAVIEAVKPYRPAKK
ncbi:DNA-directed RNA polymerase subunit F [Candidatus Micrarchaeota archaeon CG10_big_fil_rev_8_21_14_0_10_60_32]|nr:MAG: DNA-directed RNA polymerase subunit F [Candidatus Micrarchaeota archaeon CG10_big_fil_rev_8_21_14_0_10_60_32]PIY91247.1 MAG: DNA-directed RNA polymerase subunit F [Candidatus Micrarchaeota archaeon CG_4_10_14_0_8_um_filter_60_7]